MAAYFFGLGRTGLWCKLEPWYGHTDNAPDRFRLLVEKYRRRNEYTAFTIAAKSPGYLHGEPRIPAGPDTVSITREGEFIAGWIPPGTHTGLHQYTSGNRQPITRHVHDALVEMADAKGSKRLPIDEARQQALLRLARVIYAVFGERDAEIEALQERVDKLEKLVGDDVVKWEAEATETAQKLEVAEGELVHAQAEADDALTYGDELLERTRRFSSQVVETLGPENLDDSIEVYNLRRAAEDFQRELSVKAREERAEAARKKAEQKKKEGSQ